jgi:hypothetical protein
MLGSILEFVLAGALILEVSAMDDIIMGVNLAASIKKPNFSLSLKEALAIAGSTHTIEVVPNRCLFASSGGIRGV